MLGQILLVFGDNGWARLAEEGFLDQCKQRSPSLWESNLLLWYYRRLKGRLPQDPVVMAYPWNHLPWPKTHSDVWNSWPQFSLSLALTQLKMFSSVWSLKETVWLKILQFIPAAPWVTPSCSQKERVVVKSVVSLFYRKSVFHNTAAQKFIAWCFKKKPFWFHFQEKLNLKLRIYFVIMPLTWQHKGKIYTAYQCERTGPRLQAFTVIMYTCMGALCAYNLNHL